MEPTGKEIINLFDGIKVLRTELNGIFNDIDIKIKFLNACHVDLVKTHIDVSYRFGLDSFHFQNKLMHLECENMKNLFVYIDNRIYCEYYKLHRMIYDYINTEIADKIFVDKILITHKKYMVYKDLEPTKVYDFNITHDISNSINQFMNDLNKYLLLKKQELYMEQKQADIGIHIQNLIHEQQYKITLLEQKINIFLNYLNTFNIHHTNYYSRLISKLQLMIEIVNDDIKLKQPSKSSSTASLPLPSASLPSASLPMDIITLEPIVFSIPPPPLSDSNIESITLKSFNNINLVISD